MRRKEKANNKTKKRLLFGFFKKHRYLATCLVISVVALGSFFVINYSRYVKNIVEVYYLRTKNFYFNSNKLTINGKSYEINPWNGTLNQRIEVQMNSMLNSLKGTSTDIEYDVSCQVKNTTKAYCYIEGTTTSTTTESRTIPADTHSDHVYVVVAPAINTTFNDGDRVLVEIKAVSSSPYVEELKATFTLVVGDYGMNYEVEDQAGQIYFNVLVSNTLDNETRTVSLDINDLDAISFDMSNIILSNPTTSLQYGTATDGYSYVKKVTFDIEPKSSLLVRYYKNDATLKYTTFTAPLVFDDGD